MSSTNDESTRTSPPTNKESSSKVTSASAHRMKRLPSNLSFREAATTHYQLAWDHPQNCVLAIFICLILAVSGVAIATVFANAKQDALQEEALSLAEETGLFFSQNLDRAILPLFSLAQFVTELEIFKRLPDEIGLPHENGSLPFMPPKVAGGPVTHRNVTSVCDDPHLVERFTSIASTIKKNAGMEGILVNLQLVPDAVVCLVHPVNNTEDFPPGIFMDNSGALGHDLLTDSQRKFIAEATVPAKKVVIAGPLTLRQCQDCDPTVEKAFISRLPIDSEHNVITVKDKGYKKWGFAVAIINWNELVKQSGVYDVFEKEDLEFQLTRTDQNYDEVSDTFTENVVILAESSHFVASDNQVTAALPTTNNEWEMTVTYCGGSNCVGWYPYAIFASTILSLCISFLVYTIFVQKQIHNDALAEKQRTLTENAKKAARVERDLNDFIAHEVRNPLAAALSACSFVNASVNEPNPLQDEEARQSVRGDVRIIENALGFINDLLRSMLDLHRARSKQMILEFLPTDLKRDIFDPVASLLYRRDESFDVLVECSDDLVVNVDRLRLKQIVLNLARNSAKFVTKGFVRLRAENVGDGNLYIYVEDSGPGIPEEKKDELFGKFQESLDALSQGTGIGLSLCKKLIDLMDGRIKLDHNYHSGVEGRPGARFCIQFPCEFLSLDMVSLMSTDHRSCDFANESSLEDSDRHEGPCDPTTRRKKNNNNTANDNTVLADIEVGSNPGGSNKEEEEEDGNQIKVLPDGLSVLFVDDDMVLRKLFARSIRRACPTWNVQEASNGETALVLAGNENFDVIFVDQYMTSVDKQLLGTETTRMLRANGMKGIICGLSANEMEAPFLTAGADSFMLKPFQCKPEPLAQELLRVFNKRPYS